MSPLVLDILLRGRSLSVGARYLTLYPWKAGLYPREAVHLVLGQLVPCVCGRTEYCPPGAAEHSWPSSPHFPLELPQVEVTKAYFAKQADEITLQQADVVLVLQEEDGECGWGHP